MSEAAVKTVDGRDVVWEPQPRQDIALRCPALELCYGGSKGGGKDCHVASKVPTPDGWTTIGDIRVGDTVFAADGTPTGVVYVSPVYTNKRCYELTFSDGTTVVCSEDHPWSVKTHEIRRAEERLTPEWRAQRRATREKRGTGKRPDLAAKNSARKSAVLSPPEAVTLETREIVKNIDVLRVGTGEAWAKNYSIENQGPLQLPAMDFAIEPYLLGAWLGDGATGSNRVCVPASAGKEFVAQQIDACGMKFHFLPSDPDTICIDSVPGKLLADFGEKHIPATYLRSSVEQRLALLHGLMDTDGWAEKDGGCRIALSNKRLFDGVVELLRSLGVNPNVTSRIPKYTYLGEEKEGKRSYTAAFMAPFPAFRMPRKLERQKLEIQSRYKRRFIVSAREVPSVPTKCIGIDHPSHLFLVGDQMIPTHNTDLLVIACIWQIMLCHEKWIKTGRKQRGRYIIFRRNLKNLQDIIQRAEEIYPSIDPNATRPTQQKNWWTFESGYRVEFAHLDGPDDHKGYNGQELTGVGFDQVEEIPEHVYLFLRMQVRSKDPDMRKLLFVRCTANPGGPYAQWVKDYFVNGCKPHNTIIKSQVKLRGGKVRETTKAFVPATLYDNKYLAEDGAYEATLMSLPEHLRRMYLEGDWDVVVGAYFAHVWKRSIHVIPSFPIPGSWPVKFGLDWGTSAPSCTLWAAKDNDGNVYFIDELYRPGITGRTYGEAMLKKLEAQKWSSEKRWGVKDMYGLIDRQAMAATGSDGAGPSTPAAGIQWCGWRVFPANKDRAASIEQWLERLLLKPNGKPSVYIFGDRCPKLASTMSQLMADPHNPNDVDSSGDDHAFDASRFVLMDWPVNDPRKKQNKGDADVERWLEMARKRKDADEMSDYTQSTGYGD